MTDRTIRIAQSCTAVEAAAMVAAIRAFEEAGRGASRPTHQNVMTGASGTGSGSARPPRNDRGGILWTRSETSLGRGL